MAWTEATLATDIEAPDGRRVRVRATIRGVWTGEWDRWVWWPVGIESNASAPGLSAAWACAEVLRSADEDAVERALDKASARADRVWKHVAALAGETRP